MLTAAAAGSFEVPTSPTCVLRILPLPHPPSTEKAELGPYLALQPQPWLTHSKSFKPLN